MGDYPTVAFNQLGSSFAFVLEPVGKLSARRLGRLLKPGGVFAQGDVGPWGQHLLFLLWSAITRCGRVDVALPTRGSAPDSRADGRT